MQKRSFLKSPFGIAALVCFAIAFVSPFIFVDSQSSEKQTVLQAVSPNPSIVPSGLPSDTQTIDEEISLVKGQKTSRQSVTPTAVPQNITDAPQQVSQPTSTTVPQPTNTPAVNTFHVTLTINGASVGTIAMEEGNNQCDVLSRAKDQGKISQLLMKYDNSLGTNGVYQINGIGKENVVWWVYKVNGTSPTQGCSHIKANGGDTVSWEYKG